MLDINLIRENPEKVKTGIKKKGNDSGIIDRVLKVDEVWREHNKLLGEKREELNRTSEDVEEEKDSIKRLKLIANAKRIKEEIRKLEPQVSDNEKERKNLLYEIPNLPADDVPKGKDESENVEIKHWGKPNKFSFKPKDHLELGKSLGVLDFEAGSKVAGTGFYYWLNEGVYLELALVKYAMDLLKDEGFVPVITPDLAHSRFYLGTGYLPKGNEAQTFEIKDQDLGLIATAEVTLAGRHADEIIAEEKLPIKYVGYSHCFRQEAGSYGKYSKGLFRVHQFTKVEMFIYCLPEDSDRLHEEILALEERLYQGLEIPYRVMKMCTGDLGAMAAKKYDIDLWMPGRNEYGEVTSTSNCTDYQARNLSIKFRRKSGETEFVHMLNGTAIATSRTPLAILENFQQKDGSVEIPKVLQKYCGFKKITPKK